MLYHLQTFRWGSCKRKAWPETMTAPQKQSDPSVVDQEENPEGKETSKKAKTASARTFPRSALKNLYLPLWSPVGGVWHGFHAPPTGDHKGPRPTSTPLPPLRDAHLSPPSVDAYSRRLIGPSRPTTHQSTPTLACYILPRITRFCVVSL